MKLTSLVLASSSLLLTAIAGCAVDSAEQPADADDIGAADDEIQSSRLLGKYDWSASKSGDFLDMSELTLKPGGKYTAKATDPRIRCIQFPCTIGEEGTWSTHRNSGKEKLRLAPDGKPVRIYTFRRSSSDSSLTLERGESSTKLFKVASAAACKKTGCSGQICADQQMYSRCDWRPQYACYRSATCERQPNGDCAFTPTQELESCLANP